MLRLCFSGLRVTLGGGGLLLTAPLPQKVTGFVVMGSLFPISRVFVVSSDSTLGRDSKPMTSDPVTSTSNGSFNMDDVEEDNDDDEVDVSDEMGGIISLKSSVSGNERVPGSDNWSDFNNDSGSCIDGADSLRLYALFAHDSTLSSSAESGTKTCSC